MNRNSHSSPAASSTLRTSSSAFVKHLTFGLVGAAALSSAVTAQAVDYYRIGTMTTNAQHWSHRFWWSATPDGPQVAEFDPSGHYFNDSENPLRTGQAEGLTFEGASLTMVSGSISLRRSTSTQGVSTVPVLIVGPNGASVTNDIGGVAQLHANSLTLNGDFSTGPQANTRVIWLTADTVVGSGNITNGQGTGLHGTRIGFANATGWTGDIVHNWGVLDFSGSLVSGGGLVVNTALAPTINLTQSVSFSYVMIGEDSLAAGSYTFAELNATYGGIFTNGDINGVITVTAVPEPSAIALLAGVSVLASVALNRRRVRR